MQTEIRFDTARSLDEPTSWPTGWRKWTPLALLKIAIYLAVCLVFLLSFPNAIFDPKSSDDNLHDRIVGSLALRLVVYPCHPRLDLCATCVSGHESTVPRSLG